jgi:hypothetical protein
MPTRYGHSKKLKALDDFIPDEEFPTLESYIDNYIATETKIGGGSFTIPKDGVTWSSNISGMGTSGNLMLQIKNTDNKRSSTFTMGCDGTTESQWNRILGLNAPYVEINWTIGQSPKFKFESQVAESGEETFNYTMTKL